MRAKSPAPKSTPKRATTPKSRATTTTPKSASESRSSTPVKKTPVSTKKKTPVRSMRETVNAIRAANRMQQAVAAGGGMGTPIGHLTPNAKVKGVKGARAPSSAEGLPNYILLPVIMAGLILFISWYRGQLGLSKSVLLRHVMKKVNLFK